MQMMEGSLNFWKAPKNWVNQQAKVCSQRVATDAATEGNECYQIFAFQRSDSTFVYKNLLIFKYWQLMGKKSCRQMLWSQKKNLLTEFGQ